MAKAKGAPKSGGRVKGVPNKATRDVKAMAGKYGPDAIETLATLMVSADSDAAKIAAAKELLDRAYGKSTQPLSNDPENPSFRVLNEIVLRGVRSDANH